MDKQTNNLTDYDIAKGKVYFEAKQYAKKGAGTWFAKLGQSLVAVVVVLPFAGLFAAVGGIIMSLVHHNEAAYTFGLILSDLGQTVLSNLGLLFMLAILLGFTNNKGYAIFSSIIGYIAFVGFITPFIRYQGGVISGAAEPDKFNIWFWHGLSAKTQLANIFGLGQAAFANPQIADAKAGVAGAIWHGEFARLSYKGFTTLNTGVLGGICLGFIDVVIYNKGKDLHLPNMLSFFSGEKFSSVVALCVSPIVASLFIIVWPGVNYVLGEIGVGLSYLPYGIDAGLFGVAKQLLIPFEAHQALIAPLWYTSAGGQLGQKEAQTIMAMMYRIATNKTAGIGQEGSPFMSQVNNWINGLGDGNLVDKITNAINEQHVSLSNLWTTLDLGKLPKLQPYAEQMQTALSNYGGLDWTVSGDQLMTMAVLNNHPSVDIRDFWSAGLKITRFITGGYANLMFLTPAVGLAIWSTLPKGPRRRKFAFYFGAMMPSFLLGVNEPIIFMFAYTAPLIYYFWYSGVCGILFLFTALFQAKLSSTFSQGLLDYVVNGVIPTVTRTGTGAQQTMLWVPLVIGVITFFLGFALFRFLFIKNEFMAPGMEEGLGNKKEGQSVFGSTKPLVVGLLDYFGGKKNINSMQWEGKKLIVKLNGNFEYKKDNFSDAVFEDVTVNKSVTITVKMQKVDANIQRAVTYVQALIGYGSISILKHRLKLQNKDKIEQTIKEIKEQKAIIKKADRGFKKYIETKEADPMFDNAKAIESHKQEVQKQLAELDSRLAETKNDIKASQIASFNKDSALTQKLAKIEAKWQLKHDSLDQTNEIEKATAVFKENVWAITNQEQRELLSAQNKKVSPISKDTKEKVKRLEREHKQKVKELEAEKKAKIKAERHADKKAKKPVAKKVKVKRLK